MYIKEIENEKKKKLGFGIGFIDKFLDGGFNKSSLSVIYGAPGTGKSTFAYHFITNLISKTGKKVVYFDNDHAFNIERYLQIANNPDLNKLIIFKPKNSLEFELAIDNLKKIDDIGGIVIDSIASLYRIEYYEASVRIMIGKMIKAVSKIRDFIEEHNAYCLLINQIYGDISKNNYEMVGKENMQYITPIIIEVLKDQNQDNRVIRLVKHPTLKQKEYIFEIDKFGIKPHHRFSNNKLNKEPNKYNDLIKG